MLDARPSARRGSAALAVAWLLVAPWGPACSAADVVVVVSPAASPVEGIAADELAGYLGRLYPRDQFPRADQLPPDGDAIILGTVADPLVRRWAAPALPVDQESFVVATTRDGTRRLGVIAGADARGAAYGTYRLLEKLGYGFFLSTDTLPPASADAFSFAGWKLEDKPLVGERIVFEWHNFLSGCSTWNLSDWQRWTDQSRKMGYNAIMVHAYGNNPAVDFDFNGRTKPVGYLSTTATGRDWYTIHTNDVRRLWGGGVFDSPVFGADAALVPDDQHAAAARQLLQAVFAYAAERAMGVYFAIDMDTLSANPPALIQSLPEEARFHTRAGQVWLANPDTPDGYRYYKAQVAALLRDYPQVTCLVPWFRVGKTPWMEFEVGEMPARWQEEFQAVVAESPAVRTFWHAHNLFAIAKVIQAWERALQELGHAQVQIATGTWLFDFLAPCDRFLPPHVKLIGLDYNALVGRSQLRDAESRRVLREVAQHRPLIPVIWAQHDDGAYVGRPYTPLEDFHAKLADSHAAGFGIIHWTTRPLDLSLSSHVRQIGQSTQDESLRGTCAYMAARFFGQSAGDAASQYLERWAHDAPLFGRETSDWFIDRPLADVDAVVAGCAQRLALLDKVDVHRLGADERQRLDYFRGLEGFIAAFYRTHNTFERSQKQLQAGDRQGAQATMADCHPEAVIEQFAGFSSLGGITRGEQGLVVTLNTRWLSHLIRHRQALGIEPVRINFAPTSHEPLAQESSPYTFHFDAAHSLWECWGAQETGAEAFGLPVDPPPTCAEDVPAPWQEMGRTGIQSAQPIRWHMRPIMARLSRDSGSADLRPGRYRLLLLLADPTSTAAGQRVFDVSVTSAPTWEDYLFDPTPAQYLRILCQGNSENDWNSLVEVRIDAPLLGDAPAAVTASAAIDGHPAAAACDGDHQTRWAAQGKGQWLQLRLAPDARPQRIGLGWYARHRQPHFAIQVSEDGQTWSPVENLRPAAPAPRVKERLDIFRLAGQPNRLVLRPYEISLAASGTVDVELTPVRGDVIVCGAVLEPLDPSTGE